MLCPTYYMIPSDLDNNNLLFKLVLDWTPYVLSASVAAAAIMTFGMYAINLLPTSHLNKSSVHAFACHMHDYDDTY